MNKAIIMGRFTKDPEVRYTQSNEPIAIARFTLAADRRGTDAGADFISCTAFRNTAEFIEKYFHKGSKALIEGHIQTGSYTDKDNKKVYTTEVIVESIEFCEKAENSGTAAAPKEKPSPVGEGFMEVPDDVGDSGLPFN